MTFCPVSSQLRWLVLGCILTLAISNGCSTSRPPQPSKDHSSPPSRPSLSLLYTSVDSGLVLFDARYDTSRQLADDATFTGRRSVSPSGRYLAFSYTTADSSHLGVLDLTESTLQQLHAAAGRVLYSLAWHPADDRLAFGHYRPNKRDGRGSGGIQVAVPGDTIRDIGCHTVRKVLHWLPEGSLATRTDENLYFVDPDDCATQASRDARRMHHITYAPDGRKMAYIHRELQYDRSANEYVPDSSLVLSNPKGENPETLFGNERHVRHLRWSPDASELAFDIASKQSQYRQIVAYNGTRTIFLVPPDQASADQVYPRWSPSGSRLAFTLRRPEGSQAAVRVKGQTRRLGPTEGAVWGWLDDHSVVVPGPDSLRIKTLDGATRYVRPSPASLIYVWSRPLS